jgi:hypothetical protein
MIGLERALEGSATTDTTTVVALVLSMVECTRAGQVVLFFMPVLSAAKSPDQDANDTKDDGTTDTNADANDDVLGRGRHAAIARRRVKSRRSRGNNSSARNASLLSCSIGRLDDGDASEGHDLVGRLIGRSGAWCRGAALGCRGG